MMLENIERQVKKRHLATFFKNEYFFGEMVYVVKIGNLLD